MSKAEELAKKYCEGSSFEDACMERPAYIAGYHQAEKDLLENKHETSWRLDEKSWKGIKDIEKASYQYMYDASNDWAYDIPIWKDVQDAFKAGAKWKEEQMMKDAVETSVCALINGLHVIIEPEYLKEYRFGEKVKVKIFKEG